MNVLEKMEQDAPALFKEFMEFLLKHAEGKIPESTATINKNEPLNVLNEDGSGRHKVVAHGLDDDVRKAIRTGIAQGQVREKMFEWAKGFIMGVTL
jgi:hypothetical protein